MEEQKIRKARSASFSKVYATNVMLSETDSDIRLYAFNEIFEAPEGKLAVSDGTLIMTEQATMLLYEQIKGLIERWEKAGKKVEVSESRRETLKELTD